MVAVRVAHWPAAVQWYTDVLGFTVAHREEDDRFALLVLPGGGAGLALVGEHQVTLGTENRVMANIAVDDLDATLAELGGRGAGVEAGIDDGHDEGYRLGRIRDPEGNLIQLYELRGTARGEGQPATA
jgi:catechol 2,3-dioxygenase-like lactoylglutathione lyase family enzyme